MTFKAKVLNRGRIFLIKAERSYLVKLNRTVWDVCQWIKEKIYFKEWIRLRPFFFSFSGS